MKRVYQAVALEPTKNGYVVLLDGRPALTPAKHPLESPFQPLAAAIAEEWRRQEDEIDSRQMPLTRLAMTAIDRTRGAVQDTITTLGAYAETDLLCYRAADPPELAACQDAAWAPLVQWAEHRFGVKFVVTAGVVPVAQSPETRANFERAVATYDALRLTALRELTEVTGSLIIALALLEGEIDEDAAWVASRVDESFQAAKWGEDADAAARAETLRANLAAAAALVRLCHF